MQRMRTFLRTVSLVTVLGLATLTLPLPAHAWVRIGLPLPLPVIVAPAPRFVVPAAPVIVRPGYFGPRGYWHPYGWHRW